MINQIIELNWVHYYGSKFNELIHDIWAIICFFLMLFPSFNFFLNTIFSFVIDDLFPYLTQT